MASPSLVIAFFIGLFATVGLFVFMISRSNKGKARKGNLSTSSGGSSRRQRRKGF